MDSGTIERWQAAQVHRTLQPTVGYLYRLRERMQRSGFLPSDPLFRRVCQAYDSVHALFIKLHYLSCEGAGGRKVGQLACLRHSGPRDSTEYPTLKERSTIF
jgi:hypothetical protein